MTIEPGAMLGRYQILGQLGLGGMAAVYKAYQASLNREVALKVMRAGIADDPDLRERFVREAQSIARLHHPNIVQVFDFEEIGSHFVLVMEYLEGGTLKDRLTTLAAEGQKMDRLEVARVVGEVADALGYAHDLGIVHRDIKPSNVMLTVRDRAVVTDFGIAKILTESSHTQTGMGIGTPEYMSPEQGQGKGVDRRADIYSLGAMAYEMVAGRVPFTADTPLGVVIAHLRDAPPPPTTFDPTIGAATQAVILRSLAKQPADRYETAPAFARALRDTLVAGARDDAPTVFVGGAEATRMVAAPAKVGSGTLAGRFGRGTLALAAVGGLLALSGVVAVARTTVFAPTPEPTAVARSAPATAAPAGSVAPTTVATAAPATPSLAPSPTPAPASASAPAPTVAPATPIPTVAPTAPPVAPTAPPVVVPTLVPTLAPTIAPTVAPQGQTSLTLDKSTVSASKEMLSITARGYPIGTVLKWVSSTAAQGGYTIPMNLQFSTSANPHTVQVPWGGPTGQYTLHWEVNGATFDFPVTVTP